MSAKMYRFTEYSKGRLVTVAYDFQDGNLAFGFTIKSEKDQYVRKEGNAIALDRLVNKKKGFYVELPIADLVKGLVGSLPDNVVQSLVREAYPEQRKQVIAKFDELIALVQADPAMIPAATINNALTFLVSAQITELKLG